MRLSEALRKRQLVEKAADKGLEDAEALEAPELFPAWSGGAVYEQGQRVRYENILYCCLQSHTAQENWDPVSAPSLWAKVLIPDENTIPAWEQPDSTNPYAKGDKVTHNGKTWESTCDGNVWEPGVYGWEEVKDDTVSDENSSSESSDSETTGSEEITSNVAEWEQRYGYNPYMTGDRVLYNGYVYESTFDGNTYSPDTYPAGWKLIS